MVYNIQYQSEKCIPEYANWIHLNLLLAQVVANFFYNNKCYVFALSELNLDLIGIFTVSLVVVVLAFILNGNSVFLH